MTDEAERAGLEIAIKIAKDAKRYRWLLKFLSIGRDNSTTSYTCSLDLACVPFRLVPHETNPEVLIDLMMERFPL